MNQTLIQGWRIRGSRAAALAALAFSFHVQAAPTADSRIPSVTYACAFVSLIAEEVAELRQKGISRSSALASAHSGKNIALGNIYAHLVESVFDPAVPHPSMQVKRLIMEDCLKRQEAAFPPGDMRPTALVCALRYGGLFQAAKSAGHARLVSAMQERLRAFKPLLDSAAQVPESKELFTVLAAIEYSDNQVAEAKYAVALATHDQKALDGVVPRLSACDSSLKRPPTTSFLLH